MDTDLPNDSTTNLNTSRDPLLSDSIAMESPTSPPASIRDSELSISDTSLDHPEYSDISDIEYESIPTPNNQNPSTTNSVNSANSTNDAAVVYTPRSDNDHDADDESEDEPLIPPAESLQSRTSDGSLAVVMIDLTTRGFDADVSLIYICIF